MAVLFVYMCVCVCVCVCMHACAHRDGRGRRHEMEVDVRRLLLRTLSAGTRRAGDTTSMRRRGTNVARNDEPGMKYVGGDDAIDVHDNAKLALKTDVPGVHLDDDTNEDTRAAASSYGKDDSGTLAAADEEGGGRRGGVLVRAYAAFCEAIARHQGSWDELDVLDASCLVLEPEKPSYATLFRRISLSRHCSMGLTIDWRRPRAIPHLYSMMGSSEIVVPLREKMERAVDIWDDSESVVANLERVLELDLPSSRSKRRKVGHGTRSREHYGTKRRNENRKKDEGLTTTSTQMTLSSTPASGGGDDYDDMNCAICYQYRSPDGHTPDTSCGHARCGRPFHTSCLSEWLRSDPATKQSYNTLFGSCPYCEEKISCRVWIASSS